MTSAAEIRQRVETIWSEVLGVPCPPDARFFDLGGHSLAAFRILGKLEEEYTIVLDVGDLFDDPRLDEFAAQVAAAHAAGGAGGPGSDTEPVGTSVLDYWREVLAAAPAACHSTGPAAAPAFRALSLTAARTRRVREIATEVDAAPAAVLLTAFTVVVTRHSDGVAPCTLARVGARDAAVRSPVPTGWTLRDVVDDVAAELADAHALAGAALPTVLATLAEETAVPVEPARIFEAGFAWSDSGVPDDALLAGLPFTLTAQIVGESLELGLAAPRGALDALANDLLTTLDAMDDLDAAARPSPVAATETPAVPGDAGETVTIGERVGQLACAHPDTLALVAVGPDGRRRSLRWGELERRSNAVARGLRAAGVAPDGIVAIALPAGLDHVVASLAAWKLGSLVVPVDPDAPPAERAAISAALGEHTLVDAGTDLGGVGRSDGPLPPSGTPRSASLTGGTTGLPRIVVRQRPWSYRQGAVLSAGDASRGMRPGQVQLVVLPMHHAGFSALHQGLALDHLVVVMERFVPRLLPRLVGEYSVGYLRIVPALMRMVLDVPGLGPSDLVSLEAVHHGAGPCPEWVKRRWLELVEPARVVEDYASQERIGSVMIRGDEWLRHPGSVGRPKDCEVRILDGEGRELPAGENGVVHLRSAATRQPAYVGDGPELPESDGFLSLGDLGHLDTEGYLYLVGRETEVLNVGGVNVYPAEVEDSLLRHPGVADVAVTSRPHEYLGHAVHALVVPREPDRPVRSAELDAHCRAQLSQAKVPMSYQLVAEIPRGSSGKLRRRDLSDDTTRA